MEKMLRNKTAIILFVLPALLIFLLIIMVPILFSGYYSLQEWDGIGPGSFVGFDNYVKMFSDDSGGFVKAAVNSFILVGFSVFIQLPFALLLALILATGVKGENALRTIYFIPVIISTVVIGQLWMKIYHPNYGLLNVFFNAVGLDELAHPWLADPNTALVAVIIPIVWQYIGYHMLLMYASIKSIPTSIFEAAKIDGASNVATAFKITIPLIKPILKVCTVFAIVGSLKSFDLIYIITNGGPLHSSEVPSTLMFNTIFHQYKYGYGSAMSIFIVLECLVLAMIVQKVFKTDD
jgi:raffinose/stachyose/melibiose transport system permease protein